MKSKRKNNKLSGMPSDHSANHSYDTVGAVAIDREGNVASAVSTGGTWLKLTGRIGDSAIIVKDAQQSNKTELVKIWQTIKEDRKRHMHLLKEALEKEIHS